MKKYKFKQGDGIQCKDNAEALALITLLRNNKYDVYPKNYYDNLSNTYNTIYFTGGYFDFISSINKIKNMLSLKDFVGLITQYELVDYVELTNIYPDFITKTNSNEQHKFKQGDGVDCKTNEECNELLELAYKQGYAVFGLSKTNIKFYSNFMKIFTWRDGTFTRGGTIENLITVDKFLEYIGIENFISLTTDNNTTIGVNTTCNNLNNNTAIGENTTCNNLNNKEMEKKKCFIPAQMLREAYAAASAQQLIFIRENVNSETGEISEDKLRKLHDMACSSWKTKFEIEFPILKKMSKDVVINFDTKVDNCELFGNGRDNMSLIKPRCFGNFANKSFYLRPTYDWSIVKDDQGAMCLVPKRK